MHLVQVLRYAANNKPIGQVIDPGGAVFVPAPERGVRAPVYTYGAGTVKDAVFTCPVSAIPDAVWQLFELWATCRTMRALPRPGGVLDQPEIVRTAFMAFEAERHAMERAAMDESIAKAKAR